MTSKVTLNGIDNSYDSLKVLIEETIIKLQLDLSKKPLTKENVLKIARNIGVIVSPY